MNKGQESDVQRSIQLRIVAAEVVTLTGKWCPDGFSSQKLINNKATDGDSEAARNDWKLLLDRNVLNTSSGIDDPMTEIPEGAKVVISRVRGGQPLPQILW